MTNSNSYNMTVNDSCRHLYFLTNKNKTEMEKPGIISQSLKLMIKSYNTMIHELSSSMQGLYVSLYIKP